MKYRGRRRNYVMYSMYITTMSNILLFIAEDPNPTVPPINNGNNYYLAVMNLTKILVSMFIYLSTVELLIKDAFQISNTSRFLFLSSSEQRTLLK